MSNETKTETSGFDHEFFRTTGVQDFKVSETLPPPEGYPREANPDTYSRQPFAESYEERRRAFIIFCLSNSGTGTVKGFFYELIRLAEEAGPVHYGKLFGAIEYINERRDCADFVLSGIIRMAKQLACSTLMDPELLTAAKRCILDFKYWPDEPGIDSMCYWTENHHILFSVNEYLAGKMFPEEVFTNSEMKGLEKSIRAEKRIRKWMELRFKSGFIEWLSNVYYDEDFVALLNLVDFADDEALQTRGAMIVDLLLYDMAANSYYGQFVSTHGRTYTSEKKSALEESTTDTSKLLFGMGLFANKDNMSAVVFALSGRYRMPEVLFDIAADTGRPELLNRQRVSIRFKDAKKWGYGKKNLTSAMGLLSFGGYSHPRTINRMVLLLDKYGWWKNKFFLEFLPFKKVIGLGKYLGLTNLFALLFRKDLSRNAMTEGNLYTYRTPDYMLSTAQDYRKGYGGDQHHIWQASLAPRAVCFTTHPGGLGSTAPNGYWHGNGYMPRALQYKSVSIIIYKGTTFPSVIMGKLMRFTHAWLPRNEFDEIREENEWVFARKGKGYLALYSSNPCHWQEEGDEAGKELIAPGLKNIWICEMGREEKDGSFENFIKQISEAEVKIRGLNGYYFSPGQGRLDFGWNGPFKHEGKKVGIRNYPRYDNPYGRTEFAPDEISIKSEKNSLYMNFAKGERDETI
ncbi:MAG: hypothetical protein JEY99_06740 [Spirochaetales bacterium]|nr:hypothetical protein [Spirochaetales bacterium]